MNTIETFDRVVTVGIDMQNDFCPGGTLGTARGNDIIEPFNTAADWTRINTNFVETRLQNGIVVFTRCLHPEETSHFSDEPDYATTWPKHCVAGTPGANFHSALQIHEDDVIINKGTHKDEDAYSGFQGWTHDGYNLEALIMPTKLESVAVIIGGIATEVCVDATELGAEEIKQRIAPERTIGIFVLRDAVAAVNDNAGEAALARMEARGARIITTNDLIAGHVLEVRD